MEEPWTVQLNTHLVKSPNAFNTFTSRQLLQPNPSSPILQSVYWIWYFKRKIEYFAYGGKIDDKEYFRCFNEHDNNYDKKKPWRLPNPQQLMSLKSKLFKWIRCGFQEYVIAEVLKLGCHDTHLKASAPNLLRGSGRGKKQDIPGEGQRESQACGCHKV